MLHRRIRAAAVALAASAGLAACTAYGPYGGSSIGVGVGYGSPYGYGYGYPGYGYGSPYGYYAGYPYYGWYDGFYYPGSGYWVYDPDGHPHPITERQSNYWANVLKKIREARGAEAAAQVKPNFSGFRAKARPGATIRGVDLARAEAEARAQAAADQRSLQQIREVRRQARAERQQAEAQRAQVRAERQQSMREAIMERREQRRARKSGDE